MLRVQKSLDYERVSQYSLVIQAEDSGDDTRYSTATVSITVLDVNDNEPLFFDSPYYGFVRENMDILPVHVLNVSARDDDSHPFNQLSYSIREGNKDMFSMDPTTGEIKALMTLNREEVSEYILTVVATDSGWYYFFVQFSQIVRFVHPQDYFLQRNDVSCLIPLIYKSIPK